MKKFRKLVPIALAAFMAVSSLTSLTAFALDATVAGSGSLTAGSTNTVPTIKITLPTVAVDTIKLDCFNLNGAGQVSSDDMLFKNYSNVDVKVDLTKYKVTPTTGVVAATTKTYTNTVTTKQVYLEAIPTASYSGSAWTYATTGTQLKTFTTETASTISLGIAKKPTVADTDNADKSNVVGFKFGGSMNQYAVWDAADGVSVLLTYNVTPQIVVAP